MRAILTYHSIDDSGSPISIPASVFADHAAWLRSGRVRVTSIPELLALPPEADAVAVTFDDGFCNFAVEAAPLLQGLPGTLFVVTDHVGRSNEWGGRPARGIPTLPLLDWPALARLAESGVTLGAHSRTHPDLATLSPAAIEDELAGCAAHLQRETGVAPELFAYPYGSLSPTAVAAVAARFRWACTTALRGLSGHEPMAELPRIDMYYFRQPGRLQSWGTARFHAYLAARRFLRGLRR
ncbi:MAG: polysaccharide deacetylase family protein [Vicinamibacteria bacterium]|nr:polysaccharide deacetylase family protein [Vicinamibacteria bacterium]